MFSATNHCDAIATSKPVVRLYPRALVLARLRDDPEAAKAFMTVLARQVTNLRTSLEQRTSAPRTDPSLSEREFGRGRTRHISAGVAEGAGGVSG